MEQLLGERNPFESGGSILIGVLGWGICFNSFIRGEIGKPFRPGTIDDDGQSFITTSSL